jgi:hypothetical protein
MPALPLQLPKPMTVTRIVNIWARKWLWAILMCCPGNYMGGEPKKNTKTIRILDTVASSKAQ